jgi:hypothetical protein
MAVDFRRISRFGSGLLELTSYLFDWPMEGDLSIGGSGDRSIPLCMERIRKNCSSGIRGGYREKLHPGVKFGWIGDVWAHSAVPGDRRGCELAEWTFGMISDGAFSPCKSLESVTFEAESKARVFCWAAHPLGGLRFLRRSPRPTRKAIIIYRLSVLCPCADAKFHCEYSNENMRGRNVNLRVNAATSGRFSRERTSIPICTQIFRDHRGCFGPKRRGMPSIPSSVTVWCCRTAPLRGKQRRLRSKGLRRH